MKKILITAILFFSMLQTQAVVTENFEGLDANAIKAGISKYILSRGGKIDHGDSYESNSFKAVEQIYTKNGALTNYYLFNIDTQNNITHLNLSLYQSLSGVKPKQADLETEKAALDRIVASIKGRFLYGLGFEYDYYNTENGNIKAPKGRANGIKLTAVKYDAAKKGLKVGDTIIKINDKSLSEIPVLEYSTILHAKSLSDSITLTVKRGREIITVTLTPRVSSARIF